jgi:OmpA-OmpF porin, OOP family
MKGQNMRIKIVSLLSLVGALLLVPVTTQAAPATGFYIGGSWGAYSIDESDLDDGDDMLKGFVGFQFNELFGVEGQWTDFNRANDNNERFEADGKGLSGVLSFPFSDRSAVFAKLGNFWWDSDTSFAGSSRDQDGSDPFFGAGVKLGFNKHVALRVEWERYDIAGIDLDAYSAGIQFTF